MSSAGASIRNATALRPKVYIDADVLLAATASARGASHIIVKLSELALIERVISEAVQIKLRIVPWPAVDQLEVYQGQADAKDFPHLVAACLAECHSLVTHNTRHYTPKPGLIEALTPGAFLERIRAQLARLLP